ncbi:MAG: alpha/beta hydrolase fold protein [Chloroflexi bacterium]|nr:alpha/beta hydrolase fold protein [Chloroflexota bacterium]
MPTTKANGITINYEVHGDGSPLLLINGLADDLSAWGYQIDEFAQHYKTIVFDNRGIGGTEKPAGGYTTRQMAADAKELLDALGIERAHVLGVSMGGMIAQEFAIAYPGTVDKLLLCCTCSEPSEANKRLYRIWEETAPILGLGQMMKEVLLWCFTPEFLQQHPNVAQETEEALTGITQPVEAYLSQLNSIQVHNATARLGQIDAPTLVLGAPKDLIFPPFQSEQLRAGIGGSQLRFTEHGGHGYQWEAADEFNSAVLEFLRA